MTRLLLTAGGVVALITVAAFFNGLVATIEDDLAGGFNNPDGTAPLSGASARIVSGVRLMAGLAVTTLLGFGVQDLWQSRDTSARAGSAVFCAFLATLLTAIIFRRRWLLWSAVPLLVLGMALIAVLT
ncbi:MAG: hypothetical protein JWM95_291 [Gemmatimonadetes bacterium]|nr:hypothetical protein [Gemmatimonadota bacterium]